MASTILAAASRLEMYPMAPAQHPPGKRLFIMGRADQDFDRGPARLHIVDQLDAVFAAEGNVDDDNVRLPLLHLLEGFAHVGGLAADFQIGLLSDRQRQPATHDRMIVHHNHSAFAQRARSRTHRHPPPAGNRRSLGMGNIRTRTDVTTTTPRMAKLRKADRPNLPGVVYNVNYFKDLFAKFFWFVSPLWHWPRALGAGIRDAATPIGLRRILRKFPAISCRQCPAFVDFQGFLADYHRREPDQKYQEVGRW